MSGDQLDLDAIEAWFEGKTQHSSLDDLSVVPEWEAVRALVAEVRRLRARDERLAEALIAAAFRTRDVGARSTLLALSRHLDADALDAIRT